MPVTTNSLSFAPMVSADAECAPDSIGVDFFVCGVAAVLASMRFPLKVMGLLDICRGVRAQINLQYVLLLPFNLQAAILFTNQIYLCDQNLYFGFVM